MSIFELKNKYIFHDIFFKIPLKRRLAIIDSSKACYNKLDYFPITKSMYAKITNLISDRIKPKNYDTKEDRLKLFSYDLLVKLVKDIENKFKKNLTNNFQELIRELIFDKLTSENIYLNKEDFSEFKEYKSVLKFNYFNNIITFDDSFCNILTDELKNNIYNNNKIYGIKIKINDIQINELNSLNSIFKNIHFLVLDFSQFFNNFNDIEITQIFYYLDEFIKENPIEIFYFIDNTERSFSFIENF